MNNDLISRQAAIDAIRTSASKYTGFMEMEMYTDDDAVEAIEGLPSAQSEPKWISVEDRLPEKMKNILAANNRGKQWDIDKAWYNGAHFDRCGKRPLYHVTHWMPLPEPPKGELE